MKAVRSHPQLEPTRGARKGPSVSELRLSYAKPAAEMFLGISIGALGARAAVVDVDGVVAGEGAAWVHFGPPDRFAGGHDPNDWWRAADDAVLAIDPHVRRLVRGIGLAGRMHAVAVLGADDMPLMTDEPRPPLDAFGGVAHESAQWPTAQSTQRACSELGLGSMLGCVGGLAPAWAARIRTVLLPKDFIRLRLTGDKASEMSGAAATLCLDVAKRRWSRRLLQNAGLSEEQMPRLMEGAEVTGHLREEVASRWGMKQVLVAGGGADAAAASVGLGAVGNGEAILSLDGSLSFLVTLSSHRLVPGEPLVRSCHALSETWSVGAACDERRDWSEGLVSETNLGALRSRACRDDLGDEASNDEAGTGSGLGKHDLLFGGLKSERPAAALREAMHALRSSGVRVDSLSVCGAASLMCRWGEELANALDAELVYRRDSGVARVLGAARLAQLAIDGGSAQDVCRRAPSVMVQRPSPIPSDERWRRV